MFWHFLEFGNSALVILPFRFAFNKSPYEVFYEVFQLRTLNLMQNIEFLSLHVTLYAAYVWHFGKIVHIMITDVLNLAQNKMSECMIAIEFRFFFYPSLKSI